MTIIPSANKKMQDQAARLRSQCKDTLEEREKQKSLMQECEEQAKRLEELREDRARDEAEIAKQREEIADRDELKKRLDAATLRQELDGKHHKEMMEAEQQRSKADLASVRGVVFERGTISSLSRKSLEYTLEYKYRYARISYEENTQQRL